MLPWMRELVFGSQAPVVEGGVRKLAAADHAESDPTTLQKEVAFQAELLGKIPARPS
jgi:hypothetical protein